MISAVVQKAINALLASDPDMLPKVQALQGKRIEVAIDLISEHCWLLEFDQGTILVFDNQVTGQADARMRGGLFGFLRGAARPGDRSVFSDGGLEVSGDVRLVQDFAELIANLKPDWPEKVAPVLGDQVTYRLEQVVMILGRWRQDLRNKIDTDTGDYFREEARLLAPQRCVNEFSDDVDELVAAVERLEMRVNRLQKNLASDS